ncbi:MAG: hypothetical protein JST54_23990 [Deltaproteobacteria bacterium]|nr:hypothetical protein [Deltaproteobacteria bacterium]
MAKPFRINRISEDERTTELVLHLVLDERYPEEDDGDGLAFLFRIVRPVLGAVDLALEGIFALGFPASVGQKFRIQIDTPGGIPHPDIRETVGHIRELLETGKDYPEAIRQSRFIGGLRVVLGVDVEPDAGGVRH